MMLQIQYVDQYNFDVIDGDKKKFVLIWLCCKFQLDQLLCEHVWVVVKRNAYEAYNFCFPYYSRNYWYESYKGVINPLPHITQWSISNIY